MTTTFEQLYTLKIPEVRKLFLEAMAQIVNRAVVEEMAKAIDENDLEALYEASGFTPAVLNGIINKINEVYEDTANITVDSWPKRIQTPFGRKIPIFNIRNERVEQQLKNYSNEFVTNISDEVKETLRVMLSDGMSKGANPRDTALNIVGRINPLSKKREGGVIGLSSNQARWSLNARRYLENLDEKYFELGLRDKRFDSLVRKAIAERRKLTKEDIDRLIVSYNNKALKYRADAIARTETMQSINRGEWAAIEEGIENGYFKSKQIKKWWSDAHDGRTRKTHFQLGKKYNRDNAIPYEEAFVTKTGEKLMYPGDKSLGASPREIIHCRCKAVYKIDFISGLKDE